MPHYRVLQQAINACDKYVLDKDILKGDEESYHVIQANQTMNQEYQNFIDEIYMICSNTYLKQIQKYWENKKPNLKKVNPLHTSKVIRN